MVKDNFQFSLTMSKKKSTWGRLWTKNLTGCLSMVTLSTKSGGVPGLTVGLVMPSWWEWMRVSSRSKTSTFLFTIPAKTEEYLLSNENAFSETQHSNIESTLPTSNFYGCKNILLTQSVPWQRGQWKNFILHCLVLCNL